MRRMSLGFRWFLGPFREGQRRVSGRHCPKPSANLMEHLRLKDQIHTPIELLPECAGHQPHEIKATSFQRLEDDSRKLNGLSGLHARSTEYGVSVIPAGKRHPRVGGSGHESKLQGVSAVSCRKEPIPTAIAASC